MSTENVSHEVSGEGSDNYPERVVQAQLLLARDLEEIALSIDEDYRDKVVDGCYRAGGSSDIGGALTSQVSFEAGRVRESLFMGIEGEVICSFYNVQSSVRYTGVPLRTFPEAIRGYVTETDEYAESFADPATMFSVELRQTFHISTAGEFEDNYSMAYYINEDEIDPEEILRIEVDNDEDDEPIDEQIDEGYVATPSTEELDTWIEQLFSETEVAQLAQLSGRTALRQEVGVDVLQIAISDDLPAIDIVDYFLRNLSVLCGASSMQKIGTVRNLVAQIPIPAQAA